MNWADLIHRGWPFFVIFGIIFISGFWSRDSGRWLSLVRANLPYLVIPLAFSLWPRFLIERRGLFQLHFILAGAALSLYLMVYLGINFDEVLAGIRHGGSFPTPVHHVHTSLFLAIAGVLAWDEWVKHRWLSRNYMVYGVLLILIIVGLHLLAVRTGLVLFYAGTLATFIFNAKFHNKHGIIWMVIFVSLAVAVILFVPTIREKWQYFLEDIRHYDSSSWWFYSDAMRWRSNLTGWELFKTAPWWGVGMGDLLNEMHMQFYIRDHIRVLEYPHNLWITFLAGSGFWGFCLLNLALMMIFIQLRKPGNLAYRIIFFIYLLSCLVETTLMTSLGVISFVVIFLLSSTPSPIKSTFLTVK